MSELNINRNIFLEKEELLRLQRFLGPDSVGTQVLLENTQKWGIVKTVFDAPSPDFLVEVGTNLGTYKIAALSKAVDSDKLLIKQDPIDNAAITDDSLWYWVKISHEYDKLETGEVSVNLNGEVSGVSSVFSEVIRGQSTEVPVKIAFINPNGTLLNAQIYEVVDVIDDTNLILSGSGFLVESGLRYYVIGSTPVSEVLSASQLEGLYKYDSCKIELISEEILDTPPVTDYVEDKQFYIARIKNTAGTVTVEDKRGVQYLTFNIEGIDTKLDKSSNLSDVNSAEEARNNLSIYSKAEVDAKTASTETAWIPMIRGAACESAGFDIKTCRLGNTISISGKFTTVNNPSAGAIIATIGLSNLGSGIKLNNKIYQQVTQLADAQNNRGVSFYVDLIDGVTATNLNLVVDTSESTLDVAFNISFPLI